MKTPAGRIDPPLPEFDFIDPKGYLWLVERQLVGFAPLSALQPCISFPVAALSASPSCGPNQKHRPHSSHLPHDRIATNWRVSK